jgi:hypothetical protein
MRCKAKLDSQLPQLTRLELKLQVENLNTIATVDDFGSVKAFDFNKSQQLSTGSLQQVH